jgi:hypothetical protein
MKAGGRAPPPASAGLVARTMALYMPSRASCVNVTVASVNPAAANPARYSPRQGAGDAPDVGPAFWLARPG